MVEIRTVAPDEAVAFREAMLLTFGMDHEEDPGGDGRFRALIEPGRAWCATDGGHIVATAATFTHTLAVPGGALPMAGLTMVTVRPTHRRRGILRELIRRHLDDAQARGEPVSGLWASEATIYGRFGYGVAAESDELDFDARGMEVHVPGGADELAWIDEAQARARLAPIFERAIAGRPGVFARSAAWWHERRFLEVPMMRGGASLRRHVVARRGGADVGYVVYRQSKAGHGIGGLGGATEINELLAVDARAEATLWRFAAGIDLFPAVKWWNAPVDCALPWLLPDARRVKRERVDTLWLRIEDVAAALAARRYASDGEVRLGVDGAAWQLAVADGRGACAPATGAPEVVLDRAALGSIFLGGVSPRTLARAGRVTGSADAIARVERLFAWPVAPWCQEVF